MGAVPAARSGAARSGTARFGALALAALGAALALGVEPLLGREARKFPPLSELPTTPYSLQDAALVSGGMRAAAADLAWIQLLQYAAGGLAEMPDARDRAFDHMKTLSLRVVRLDPSFHRAYLFGAGVLGWFNNVRRPDEAVDLLEEGIRRDPGQPLYSEYVAALAYKKSGDTAHMVSLLESIAFDPGSPIEMKAILANLYKSRGDYAQALALWEEILGNDAEAREWPRARDQEAKIRALMKAARAGQGRQ
jgi:tetratricopeptide (TPR) repeat protein